MSGYNTECLFDLTKTIAAKLFEGVDHPWKVLAILRQFILTMGTLLPWSEYEQVEKDIWIAKDARIMPSACLNGPLIVDHGAEIRCGAFIRGGVIVGKETVVGNSTELKNCILFDHAQVPHFNYVGDSVLGAGAHLGAGAITSNLRLDKKNIVIRAEDKYATGLRKLGSLIGDRAEVGCNAVLNPGTVLGRECIVYPCSCVRGYVPERFIHKVNGELTKREV